MKPVIVTGSQRSGTSVVAGIMFYLGIFMGNYFLKKDKHNPTGYFEDVEFGDLDEQRHTGQLTKGQWKKKVEALVKTREPIPYGFTQWGWKNPSASLYIDDYIELLQPRVIWCRRKKEDTIKSIGNMYGEVISTEGEKVIDFEKTYTKKTNKMEEAMKEYPHLEINFEELLENPDHEIGRIAGYLGIKPSKRQIQKARNHIITKPTTREEEHYTNYL